MYSSYDSDISSHRTLLGPRELNSSFDESLQYNPEQGTGIDRADWRDRKDFFFTTLSFLLSLANLWRFPLQAYMYGQGSFVMLYIIFTLLIGSALLFFEIALGQYCDKGFTKVFAICPIFEGLAYSMAIYCTIMSVFYNVINVTSLMYVVASFYKTLPYSKCIVPEKFCLQNSTNETFSPQAAYYKFGVWYHGVFDYAEATATTAGVNWRNIGILFFLWALIAVAIVLGIRTVQWPYMAYCPVPYIILLVTLIATCTISGSGGGIVNFFLPRMSKIQDVRTWGYAFEQTIVTLGLGMGPLITFGSYSHFQSPAHKDSALLTVCVLISSLFAGTVFFGIIGILAAERRIPFETVFLENGVQKIHAHVVYSHLFARLPNGLSHVMSFLFFFMFCFAGWFSLISYTETLIVALYGTGKITYKHKRLFNASICALCFLLGSFLENKVGYRLISPINTYFLGCSLHIILLFEAIGVVYIYGMFNFCDDIEFMLGFYPNVYYQIIWLITPVLFVTLQIHFIFWTVNQASMLNYYHWTLLVMVFFLIIGPILAKGAANVYYFYRKGEMSRVFHPMQFPQILVSDELSLRHSPPHSS